MGITVKEYASEMGITHAAAEARLRRKVEMGEYMRHKGIGNIWIYEIVIPTRLHDPFNLGSNHPYRIAGPNLKYKYLREE